MGRHVLLLTSSLSLLTFLSFNPVQFTYIALPIVAGLSAFVITRFGRFDPAWRWAALGSQCWAIEEFIWMMIRLGWMPEYQLITNIFYVSGALFWAYALLRMPLRAKPQRALLTVVPVLGFMVTLMLLDVQRTLLLLYPLVELAFLLLIVPLLSASFRGNASEGRILWSLGFVVRVLNSVTFVSLSQNVEYEQYFYILWLLSYMLIGLGGWFELKRSMGNLWTIAYSVLGLELIVAFMLLMISSDGNTNRWLLGSNAVLMGYILFFGVILLISGDRNRRQKAELELKQWTVLLERLLAFEPEFKYTTLHPKFYLQKLLELLVTFFPSLSGITLENVRTVSVGVPKGYGFPLVSDGSEIGHLYFERKPRNLPLLDALSPVLVNRLLVVLSQEAWHQQALTDPLTHALNRRGYQRKITGLLSTAKAQKEIVSVAMLDLDYFKRVNDQYGHDTGDKALMTLANILRNHTRSNDLIVRWGGEEFLIILYGSDVTAAAHVIDRVQKELKQSLLQPIEWPLTLSAGIAAGFISHEEQGLESWISAADRALFVAKNAGRDKIHIHDQLMS